MVKTQNNNNSKSVVNQGERGCPVKANKIEASTAYEYCKERLSPFGGLLGLEKFMALVKFKEIFDGLYKEPSRRPELGHYNMKKGFRPVLSFIQEKREYFVGKLRKGETIGGEEAAELIRSFKKYLPGCVKEVILRGDGEFIGWESVKVAYEEGYEFIFGNKGCNPPFDPSKWYKVRKGDKAEYNECIYQPIGWERECRFVAMRIPKEEKEDGGSVQLTLIEDAKYIYRIFVTSLNKKPHKVIAEYDKRADCENLIGEAKREGLAAIPSSKFANNYAYFQIVMLAYNIWRSFKMLAGHGLMEKEEQTAEVKPQEKCETKEIIDNTIRIARLKLLFIAAKITSHSNTDKVKYSRYDSRVPGLFKFFKYLDKRRQEVSPWLDAKRWLCKHLSVLNLKPAVLSA